HVDGMVGDRRRQREREAGRDRVARPLDGAVVVVTLTIVIAAAVLAPAGVYRAADAASLGCCKPARLIQLHNVCGAVFAESHIDDRCPRPLLRTTALWAEVDAVVGNLDLCALVVICTATDMSCVRLNPPYSREAGRSGKAGQFPCIDRSVRANSNRRGDGISRERIGQTTNVGRARRTCRGGLPSSPPPPVKATYSRRPIWITSETLGSDAISDVSPLSGSSLVGPAPESATSS